MNTEIFKPVVTEKMNKQGDAFNRYGFWVTTNANKLEIKAIVEKTYGVKVVGVNTINYRGKNKSRYTKAGMLVGRGVHRKKAIVTLAKDNKIDFYSNI
jgi:large subunit ribosomal protein L23